MTNSAASYRVARVLQSNLESTFGALCTERYGGPIALEEEADGTEHPWAVRFRIRPSGQADLRVHFEVRHVGGNVFDLRGEVEGGPSRSFTYSLPDPSPLLVPAAPDLTRNVASFLLDAMERRVGSGILERTARNEPPRSPESGHSSSRRRAREESSET